MTEVVPAERPLRVLVVDDDPAIREICSVNLGYDGFDVLEAEDGQRGLERAVAELPDVVLLDVVMPVLDGFELAAALRRNTRTRELPLVFLSGETDGANKQRAEELGALGFFDKPFDPAAVSSFIAGVARGVAPRADAAVYKR